MNIENDLLVGYEPLDPAAFKPYRVEVTHVMYIEIRDMA